MIVFAFNFIGNSEGKYFLFRYGYPVEELTFAEVSEYLS